jgi:hypothetical protein
LFIFCFPYTTFKSSEPFPTPLLSKTYRLFVTDTTIWRRMKISRLSFRKFNGKKAICRKGMAVPTICFRSSGVKMEHKEKLIFRTRNNSHELNPFFQIM